MMPFSRPSLSDIYGRIKADMESRVTGNTKIPRFSLLGILAAVFAGAVWSLYGFISWLARQLFPETADAEFLENHALRFGLVRKAATFAEGVVRFDGTVGTAIPSGTQLQTTGGVPYTTTAAAVITAGVTVSTPIVCSESGAVGNTTDEHLYLVHPVAGIGTEVAIVSAPVGGQDAETTEELRARVIQRTANPPFSGNPSDFVRWALEVPGVARAWCLPGSEYHGAGTVGVVISTADLSPVDSATHASAVEYLETVRPIGAVLTVEDVIQATVDYRLTITPNTQAMQSAVISALGALHKAEASPGGTIYLSHITAAIMSAGVDDMTIGTIIVNDHGIGPTDITVAGFAVAAFRSATFTF